MQLDANHTIDETPPPLLSVKGSFGPHEKFMLNHSREQEKQKWAFVF